VSAKTVLERLDYGSRGQYHAEQSVDRGVIRRTLWGRLINSYINGDTGIKLCFQLHSRNPSSKFESGNFALVFQKSRIIDEHGSNRYSFRQYESGFTDSCPRSHEMESPVPVYARPVIDNPEITPMAVDCRLRGEFVNVVRLYRLDDCTSLSREWLDLPGGICEFVGGPADGEFQGIFIGGRVLSGFQDGTLVNTGIKCRSELTKHFSEFETSNWGESKDAHWLDSDSPCPIVIHAYNGSIGIFTVAKLVPSLVKSFSVGLCPCDSLPTVIK
jgi:hypothetical protein